MVNKLAFVLLLLTLSTCKDPYNIKVNSSKQFLLVVEGNIDTGSAGTTFRLSLTAPVNDSGRGGPPVSNAVLSLEGKDQSIYPLPETMPGTYTAFLGQLRIGEAYRLHIKTKEGKEYRSDYVTLIGNPPIDSLNWNRTDEGVTIYVNTHDPANQTHYYRWSFDEVYEFHGGAVSKYMFASPQVVVKRTSSDQVYFCWRYDTTGSIFTGSSAKLSSDIIHNYPLVFYQTNSEPLAVKYRIHVNQYALSKDAYDFYTMMKKNTESLGTVFDPLPTAPSTNIHCISDPNENVIGFVTASPVQEKILFIKSEELPGWSYGHLCYEQHIGPTPDSLEIAYYNGLIPIDVDHTNGGYLMSDKGCADCTTRGTNVRPPFW